MTEPPRFQTKQARFMASFKTMRDTNDFFYSKKILPSISIVTSRDFCSWGPGGVQLFKATDKKTDDLMNR